MSKACFDKIRNDIKRLKPKSTEDKLIKENINFILSIMARKYWMDDSITEDIFNSLYLGLRTSLKKYDNKYKVTTFLGKYVPYILSRALARHLIPVTGLKRFSLKQAFDTINIQSIDEILDDKTDYEPCMDNSLELDTDIDSKLLVQTIKKTLNKKCVAVDEHLYRVDKYSMEDLTKLYGGIPYTTLYQRRQKAIRAIRKYLAKGDRQYDK